MPNCRGGSNSTGELMKFVKILERGTSFLGQNHIKVDPNKVERVYICVYYIYIHIYIVYIIYIIYYIYIYILYILYIYIKIKIVITSYWKGVLKTVKFQKSTAHHLLHLMSNIERGQSPIELSFPLINF